ncbi:MAG: AmmeMemoRadiSam system protein A [Schwartzia sp.]|nr:AmmeMemoRadiSam system protein A [Schwartzia sp. (in: firmicutes)]
MGIAGAVVVPHPPLIMPEVGRGEEKKIQTTIDAYREAMRRMAALKPDVAVISSPHATMYADYFHISPGSRAEGDFGNFRVPGLKLSADYDTELVQTISRLLSEAGVAGGTMAEREPRLDHGTMVPLRFVQEVMPDVKIIRVGLSGLSPRDHYRFGECVAQAAELLDRRVVYVASGDLSHKLKADGPYGFAPEGPVFDEECMEALATGDFLRLLSIDADLAEGAAECGLRSFWMMAGALDRRSVECERLSHEGTFGVGYGVATFIVGGRDESRAFGELFEKTQKERLAARKAAEDEYVRLARMSLETFVKTGKRAEVPKDLPPELAAARAGAFVSLKKDGMLRGCIGTILPVTDSLGAEILRNAVSACSEDPRFDPVREDELDALVYSVDVLTEPEPIASDEMLDPKRYGVIVESGGRRGLLLPDLAGIDTVAEQLSIACRKGGIDPNGPVKLWRFEVVRHH